MAELLERLQQAIGNTYRIEKELGGGGMSRVFLAEEIELGRKVVIKVLPPDMAAGVNKERFHREIQLAARLQHPHVVSLLTAGAKGDLLYYVMPYIEGESLRGKLQREGELPVGEAVRLLKEIVDALAYAHSEGVVHRDIKPDNVLLSRNHAVVTDFGVSKAVTASSGSSSLTSLGVALGTPAYMAPEQAAADPHTDHRADIYAVGAMAYEMLTGRPPFTASTPQAVMAAHVSEAPDPLTKHRSAASESLNGLVMRCLEKKAADRWQSAGDLIPQLEAMTTPSGGITPTGTAPVAAVSAESLLRRSKPLRVVSMFALASIGALAVVYSLVQLLALPDWVIFGAIALLAIGLPIMMLTGHHERRRAIARTTGVMTVTPPGGMRQHFTWQKSLLGGGLAFAGLGVIASGYMVMRVLGVGPAGTLITTGVLEERDQLILADFANFTADTTLGRSVTEAFRIDLAQSPVVRLLDATDVSAVLERMERPPEASVDITLARELAQREGVKAFVSGEISPLGDGYVLSATLVSSAEGNVLEALRETADDRSEIIGAVDRLSAKLRERIGESLRTIRANPPLDRVTTSSLEALEKYSRSLQAEQEGDMARSLALLEEAIALDSAFAMAYRRLGVVVRLAGGEASRGIDATTKAFEYRDRLPDIERYLAEAYYFGAVAADLTQSTRAYRSLLELDPYHATALNNLAALEGFVQRWPEAEELAVRGMEISNLWQLSENAAWAQVAQGKFADARTTIERLAQTSPDSPRVPQYLGLLHSVEGRYDSAQVHFTVLATMMKGSPVWQGITSDMLASLAQLQGKVAVAETHIAQSMQAALQRNQSADYLRGTLWLGWLDLQYRENPARGIQRLDIALAEHPLADMPAADRPYLALAEFFASANQPAKARALLTNYEEVTDERLRRRDAIDPQRRPGSAAVALAEGRVEEAIANFRRRSDTGCAPCGLFGLARAFEAADMPDSALAVYERRVRTPGLYKVYLDAGELAPTYRRLGELYEERGDRERAIEHYNNFVELWSDADPELQDQVRDVRERIARLISER